MMVRLTLKPVLLLLLSHALLGFTALTIGSMQLPNQALQGFSECSYGGWCLFGIHPGKTTVREADQHLREAGYERINARLYRAPVGSDLCDVMLHSANAQEYDIVWSLLLDCTQQEIRIVDVVDVMGTPTGVGNYCSFYDMLVYTPPMLIFHHMVIQPIGGRRSLFDPLSYVYFFSVHDEIRVIDWENFNYYKYFHLRRSVFSCD